MTNQNQLNYKTKRWFNIISQYITLDNPLSIAELSLWILCISITILLVIITIKKYTPERNKMERIVKADILTWILFFVFLGIGNTFNIVWRFIIQNSQIAEFIDMISIIFVYLAVFIKIFHFERSINIAGVYKGYYFSILNLIGMFFLIINNPTTLREFGRAHVFVVVLLVMSFAIFPGIYLYIAIKSVGDARKRAIIVFFASFLLGGGMLLQPQNIEGYATLIENLEYWVMLSSIFCPIGVSLSIILIFSSYKGILHSKGRTIEKTAFSKELTLEKPKEALIETLIKSRPSQITKEEVSFYREQKICLVCKGKVLRFNYICPECEALYCKCCAQALTHLENECWVCESPFDKSKPKKISEKKEEKIKVREDIDKKGKNRKDKKPKNQKNNRLKDL